MAKLKLYMCVLLLIVGSIFVEHNVSGKSILNGGCPRNKPEVQCEVDPCTVTPYGYCPLHPKAVCKPYKCGVCTARWYNNRNERVYCYAF